MIVGVLGGTFDPPHLGHLGVARTALASKQVDKIWLVPCLAHRFGKQPGRFENRLAMCRLLIEDEPDMAVSDIEVTLKRPGYTLDLVKALYGAHPEWSFRLIAGADIYHEKEKWHCYDEIADLAPPIYVARKGIPPITDPTLEAPMEISSTELRAAFSRGERPVDAVLSSIITYIETHRLY